MWSMKLRDVVYDGVILVVCDMVEGVEVCMNSAEFDEELLDTLIDEGCECVERSISSVEEIFGVLSES